MSVLLFLSGVFAGCLLGAGTMVCLLLHAGSAEDPYQ